MYDNYTPFIIMHINTSNLKYSLKTFVSCTISICICKYIHINILNKT